MSRFSRFALICLILPILAACSDDRQPPDAFALEVAASVAANDFDRFWAMNSRTVEQMAEGGLPLPTDGLASAVSPWNERKVHDDFDRIVRARRIQASRLSEMEAVLVATEHQRWALELFDRNGRGVGVGMQLRDWHEGYRVVTLYLVEPGKARDSVVVYEG